MELSEAVKRESCTRDSEYTATVETFETLVSHWRSTSNSLTWNCLFTLRDRNQEKGQEHIIPGADEYQLMVEHFADAVMKKEALAFSLAESVCNMRVLDALAEAARTWKTIAVQ